MTEAHANPELVAFHRESELAASQRAYEMAQTASENSLATMPSTTALTPSAHVLVPPKPEPPSNPIQHLFLLRVSIVAILGLVVLLVYLKKTHAPN